METVSRVGSASLCFVSRGGVGLHWGFAILSPVVLCAFLDTVAAVYLWATPQDRATFLQLTALAVRGASAPSTAVCQQAFRSFYISSGSFLVCLQLIIQ